MSIISSICVYNFHLIISYLRGGVRIVPFKDNRNLFYASKARYLDILENGSGLLEMQGNKHILFGTQNGDLKGYNLSRKNESQQFSIIELPIHDISQITIDYQQKDLFAYSENNGFLEINISSQLYPQIKNEIIPEFQKKIINPVISNMEALDNGLLISVRNYGVASVAIKTGKSNKNDIRLEDPQDARRVHHSDIIAIADIEGLVLYDMKQEKTNRKINLPNNDFPQQLEVAYGSIIIKGAYGLYIYSLKNNKLITLVEGKIGAITTYYDYVFFTQKGKVFSLTLNNTFEQHGFQLNTKNLDFEFEKITSKAKD